MQGIYKIENNITKECYIGQSIDITRRWRAHKLIKEDNLLTKAFLAYGIENFSFEVLEKTSNNLNQKEKEYIFLYNSYEKGYNQTSGGSGNPSFKELDLEKLIKIKELLKTTQGNETEIGFLVGVSRDTVSAINQGRAHFSQEEFYPIRKITKKSFFCQDCKAEISYQSLRCPVCAGIKNRKVERPTREILKDEIRNLSFSQLSKKYGVSDNAIRKWCKNYNLPSLKKEINSLDNQSWDLV